MKPLSFSLWLAQNSDLMMSQDELQTEYAKYVTRIRLINKHKDTIKVASEFINRHDIDPENKKLIIKRRNDCQRKLDRLKKSLG